MPKPIIALMYDFDKTLSTTDMQNYSFIPSLNIKEKDFWNESDLLAKENNMDSLLAYMYLMLRKAKENNISLQRKSFVKLGKDIMFYPGVINWFDRITKYGNEIGVKIEHYIISSGLNEIIEGSPIYKKFKMSYACEYLYDASEVAVWPKNVVNYTTKTQFLFRINKGSLDIFDNQKVNKYIPEEERRIPFKNMIYFGDGLTDVPCMRLVKANGGRSIAVYGGKKDIANSLLNDGRVDFVFEADYSENSKLDKCVKSIISAMKSNYQLDQLHLKDVKKANATIGK